MYFVTSLRSLRSLMHYDEIADYESKRIRAQRKFGHVFIGFGKEVDRSGGQVSTFASSPKGLRLIFGGRASYAELRR